MGFGLAPAYGDNNPFSAKLHMIGGKPSNTNKISLLGPNNNNKIAPKSDEGWAHLRTHARKGSLPIASLRVSQLSPASYGQRARQTRSEARACSFSTLEVSELSVDPPFSRRSSS